MDRTRRTKRLRLRKDTLRELTPDEAAAAVGGKTKSPDASRYCLPGTKLGHHTNSPDPSRYCLDEGDW